MNCWVLCLFKILCDAPSKFGFYVVPFLATSYSGLLSQDILSEKELIIDCGNGANGANGNQWIEADRKKAT